MATSFGVVIGIDKDNTGEKNFRVLVAHVNKKANDSYDWKFNCSMMTNSQVINSLLKGNKWLNLKLDKDESGKLKVKGSTGSLERFEGTNRPYVILSQINNEDGKVLGYKVASYEGRVRNVVLKEMLAYGNRATKSGGTPVQNAIFVPAEADRREHYKNYPGHSFLVETVRSNNNKHTEVKRVNTAKNEKTLSKLEEIYNKEQIEQLKLGKVHSVEIRVYANPALSAKQMEKLRKGLERKVNVRPLAFPEFSAEVMQYYIEDAAIGLDIKKYLNPKYNLAQIAELSLAVEEGLDISKMSNPKLNADEMAEIRERLERRIWKDELVKKDGSWN